VEAVSEGVRAIIHRALEKRGDLLLEGVHYFPNKEVIEEWRDAGGIATGVVLYVTSENMHRGMIANREKHNGKQVDHYLVNLGRIREIQEELVVSGSHSEWLLVDPTKESGAADIITNSLG
jgi:2-phosphoglycerate kinase